MENAIQKLIDAGIDEALAVSMVKSMLPKAPKAAKKKKAYRGNSTYSKRVAGPVIVDLTCQTCGTKSSYKRTAMVYSSEETPRVSSVTSLCVNCIGLFETLTKDELISLLVIQNHPEIDLRNFGTKHQIKLAKQKSALDWLVNRMPKQADPKRDEEDFVETKSEKEGANVKTYVH